jgi:hypothetical protein
MAEVAIWIVSFVAVGWLGILCAYAIGMILLLPVTGLAWVIEDMFPRVRLLLQPVGNVASRYRPAARAAISVLPRSRAAIVIFLVVISCGAYLVLRPRPFPVGHQSMAVNFDDLIPTSPAQNSALGDGVTIKANPLNQFDHSGTKTPVFELTDKDGSTYTVDAQNENAALAAFEGLRHCKQAHAVRFRTYNPATGTWTVPIQVRGPDGSISEFPEGMADADMEAVLARAYPPLPATDPYAAFSSPVYRAGEPRGDGKN